MMICPACGVRFEDSDKFCNLCGSRLVPFVGEQPADPEPKEAPVQPVRPAQPAYVPPAEARREPVAPAEKPAKQRSVKTVGGGRRFLAGLLCVFLFLSLLVPAVSFMAKRSLTREGLTEVLNRISVADIRVDPYIDDIDDECTAAEMLADELSRAGSKLDEEGVAKILDSKPFKGFFAEQLASLVKDISKGKARYAFDINEMNEVLTGSKMQKIYEKEELNVRYSDVRIIDDLFADYGFEEFFNYDTLKEEAPEATKILRYGLDTGIMIAELGVALLFIILIFVANRGRFSLSIGDIGGTVMALGLLLTLVTLIARFIPELWLLICGEEALIADAGGAVLNYNLYFSLIVFGAGLVLAVLGRILRPRKTA